jgi:hypothetical protein
VREHTCASSGTSPLSAASTRAIVNSGPQESCCTAPSTRCDRCR